MKQLGRYRLIAHPEHPPRLIRSVQAEVRDTGGGGIMLTYIVEPATSLLLTQQGVGRQDGLWRHTCFELFLKRPGGGYREFNFAPDGAWNAYDFSDWRIGMSKGDVGLEPNIVDCRIDDRKGMFPDRYEVDAVVWTGIQRDRPLKMSLTAVIEEQGGTKSYWALAHPPGDPNFHHPACFVLELPPPSRA